MVQAASLATPPAKSASDSQQTAKVHDARSSNVDKSSDKHDKFALNKENKTDGDASAQSVNDGSTHAQNDASDTPQQSQSAEELVALIAQLAANHDAAQQPLKASGANSLAMQELSGGKFDPLAKLQASQTNPLASYGAASSSLNDGALANSQLMAQLQANSKLDASPVDSNLIKLASASVEGNALSSNAASALSAALGTGSPAAPSHGASNANPAAMTTGTEWASMRIDTQAGKWGEQMLQVLQDRVTLQAQQNLQEAKIRLDPPELGKLDLMVRVEGDRLSVQIHSNTAVTREALMQISDRLRSELQDQNFMHVDVNVSSGEGGNSQPSQQEEDATIFAARRENDNASDPFSPNYSEHWLNTQA